jgi:hypothetical protein
LGANRGRRVASVLRGRRVSRTKHVEFVLQDKRHPHLPVLSPSPTFPRHAMQLSKFSMPVHSPAQGIRVSALILYVGASVLGGSVVILTQYWCRAEVGNSVHDHVEDLNCVLLHKLGRVRQELPIPADVRWKICVQPRRIAILSGLSAIFDLLTQLECNINAYYCQKSRYPWLCRYG